MLLPRLDRNCAGSESWGSDTHDYRNAHCVANCHSQPDSAGADGNSDEHADFYRDLYIYADPHNQPYLHCISYIHEQPYSDIYIHAVADVYTLSHPYTFSDSHAIKYAHSLNYLVPIGHPIAWQISFLS